MKPINKWLGALVIGGSATGMVVGAAAIQKGQTAVPQATRQDVARAEALADVFRDVGKRVEPSVVEIQVRKTVKSTGGIQGMQIPDDIRKFFPNFNFPQMPNPGEGGSLEQVGTGSGVIMEVDGNTGYILTNNHVAGGASEMTVTLADGRKIDNGKLVGADPKSDLAVVKIESDGLRAAQWGDSADLHPGDWVMAFGAPFGYVGSMTHGIVSALDRTHVGILGSGGYEDFIQVDAPINPGNSGGPLVNLAGEVVGINTAIASQSGGFQGIGFAIPVNEAKWVYSQLKEHGKVTRGWLGVAIADVSQDRQVAKGVGYDKSTGVLVEQVVPSSPARGRLDVYDVITEVNGTPVNSVAQLRNMVAEDAPGSKVDLTVFRNGKDQQVHLTLGTQPQNMLASENRLVAPGNGHQSAEALGMNLATPTQELSEKYGLSDNSHGAVVMSVTPRSAAERAGLQPGDLITQVDRKPVGNAQEAADRIARHAKKTPILLYVENNAGGHIVAIEPAK